MTYELDSEEVTINATAEVKPDDVVRMNHPDKGAKGKDKRAGMGKGDNWKWAWKPGTAKEPLDLLLGGGETEDFLDKRGTKEDVNINDDKRAFTMNMDKETDNDVDKGGRGSKEWEWNKKPTWSRPGSRDLFNMIKLRPLEDKCCAHDQKKGKVVSCIDVVLNPNMRNFENLKAGFVVNGIPFSYSGPNGDGRSYFIYKGESTYQFMNGFNGDKYKFGKAVISDNVNLPHLADFRMGSDSGSGFTDFSVEKCQRFYVFKQIEYVMEDKELTTTPATVTSIDIENDIENIFRLFKKRQCIIAYNKKLTDQGIEALTKVEKQNFRECKDDLIDLIDNLKNMDFQEFLDHLDELEDYIDELDDHTNGLDNHTDELDAHFNEGNKNNIRYLFGTIYFHTLGSNSMGTEANTPEESKFKFIQGKDKVVGMIEMEEMMDEMK